MKADEFGEFRKNLGETVKKWRTKKGLTQGKLSSMVGKPQSTIARFESAYVNDTQLGLIYQISKALDIDMALLISEAMGQDIPDQKAEVESHAERISLINKKINMLPENEREEVLQIFDRILKIM